MEIFDTNKNMKPNVSSTDAYTRPIIEKWYRKLDFEPRFDEQFYSALDIITIEKHETAEKYDLKCTNGKRNLLAFLYFCEETANRYSKKGIPEELLFDNLHDIAVWTRIWSDMKGELYLGELGWLKLHMTMQLFKLGRLQFCFETNSHECHGCGPAKGEKVIGVHIPERGPLINDECRHSFAMAGEFFAKYYPEYKYEYYTCHSWLLGKTPRDILGEKSNIAKFANMFDIPDYDKSDDILRYVFKWNTSRETVGSEEAKTTLAKEVKRRAAANEDFDCGFGFIKKPADIN